MPAGTGAEGYAGGDRNSTRRPAPTAVEREAAEAARTYRKKRRLIRTGQVLMMVGVIVGAVHVLAHLEVFGGQPSALVDVVAGYPAAGALFVLGAILAGQ
jgi:hypothetical protein